MFATRKMSVFQSKSTKNLNKSVLVQRRPITLYVAVQTLNVQNAKPDSNKLVYCQVKGIVVIVSTCQWCRLINLVI